MKNLQRKVDNPAYVLRLIRDGINDWSSLCSHMETDPQQPTTSYGLLTGTLQKLVESGLVEVNQDPQDLWKNIDRLTFKVSQRWMATQSALKVSLRDIAKLSEDSFIAEPFFGPPDVGAKAAVFVMMPFLPELEPVYENHLSRVARDLKLSIRRADNFSGAHSIMKDIWNAIVGSKICIADCTGRNPNVFYEIGIAHTVGRPVVLITQTVEDIPFDLGYVRHIVYELTPQGMKKFEDTLRSTLAFPF